MGVHVGVSQQAEFFELVGGEEVGFVDDHDDVFASFVVFGGEQVGGWGIRFALWNRGLPPSAVTMLA